jgi:hypothetical protein
MNRKSRKAVSRVQNPNDMDVSKGPSRQTNIRLDNESFLDEYANSNQKAVFEISLQ